MGPEHRCRYGGDGRDSRSEQGRRASIRSRGTVQGGVTPRAEITERDLGPARHASRPARSLVGEVAQSVEHAAENRGVGGSIPPLPTSLDTPSAVALATGGTRLG
jgi:hypothetical protein